MNSMMRLVRWSLSLSCIVLLSCNASLFAQESERPNVVFFLVDDLGYFDISYTGSSFYETPHIDKLAAQSKFFTNAYSAHPRCVPSRYAMITGNYPARINSPGKGEGHLNNETTTIAEPFKAAGYTTFFAGKWHLASSESYPEDQGFDFNYGGGHAGAPKSYFQPYNEAKNGYNGNGRERNITKLDDAPEGYYLTDHLTDKTVSFINNHANTPFLIYLSHYGVHTPFDGKKELIKTYREKAKTLYPNEEEAFEFEATTGETKLRQDNAIYAAMIQSVDESLGRLIEALKAKGVYENTIIVFTSDHGGLSNRGNGRKLATSNLPLRAGKGHNYEGGIKVPMYISWPGRIQAGYSQSIVTGTDYFPTLLEICDLPLTDEILDGKSFSASLLQNSTQHFDRPVFWHSPVPRPKSTGDRANTAVRLGNYKLLDFYEDGRIELYDLKKDPEERNDLSDLEPEKVKELMLLINDWRKEVQAFMGN